MITDIIKNKEEREYVIAIAFAVAAAFAVAIVAAAFAVAIAFAVTIAFAVVIAAAVAIAAAVFAAADTKTLRIMSIIFAVSYFSAYFAVTSQVVPLWATGLAILAIGEIIFYFEEAEPKKNDSKLWFTAKRKLGCLGEASLIVVNVVALISQVPNIVKWIGYNYSGIAYWIGVLGFWLICIVAVGAVALGYIWLNSQKYRK